MHEYANTRACEMCVCAELHFAYMHRNFLINKPFAMGHTPSNAGDVYVCVSVCGSRNEFRVYVDYNMLTQARTSHSKIRYGMANTLVVVLIE